MAEDKNLGIIDLTKVAAPDIRVKLRRSDDSEAIYRLPGNAPSGLMVQLMVLLREVDAADEEDLEGINALRIQIQEEVDRLFALRNKDYADGEVELNDEELATLIAGLFSRYYNAGEDGDRPTEPETTEEEPTSPSTPPRQRSARRSNASSRTRKAPSRSSTSSPT